MEKQIIVFGEIHNNDSVEKINAEIEKIKPDVIFHELAFNDISLYLWELEFALKNMGEGKQVDPRINKDVYEQAIRLKASLIGIDLDPDFDRSKMTDKEFFKKREENMVSVIKRYLGHVKHKAVIVVGDDHLRETTVSGLDVSPLAVYLNKNKKHFEIVRAKDL